MGLDKWLKPEDEKKKKKQEAHSQKRKIKGQGSQEKPSEKYLIELKKYILICPNAKCKYQKTIMKKKLTEADTICPRCNKKMKTKVG